MSKEYEEEVDRYMALKRLQTTRKTDYVMVDISSTNCVPLFSHLVFSLLVAFCVLFFVQLCRFCN